MTRIRPSVRLLIVGGTISYRALFAWMTPALIVGSLIAAPILQMIFFVYIGRGAGVGDDRFFVLGNSILAVSIPGLYGGVMAVANERLFGTLDNVLTAPANRILLWLGRAIPYAVNGLLVGLLTLSAGMLLFGVTIPVVGFLAVLSVMVLASMSCSVFGLCLGALSLRFRDLYVAANLASAVLLVLCGINVSRDQLPGAIAEVGGYLPLTHAAESARLLAAGDFTWDAFSGVLGELGVAALYSLAAVALLQYFERSSRRHATLNLS